MPYTEESKRKARETLIKKYGSYEAYKEHMKTIGKKGGETSIGGAFMYNRELASRAGKIGGSRKRNVKK